MKKTSQKLEVLKYLQAGNRISPIKAIAEFGEHRLSARIFELRCEGHTIRGNWKKAWSGRKYMEYRLSE